MPTAKRKAADVLRQTQCEIRAPKGQRNQFGGYNYRSAEDICEAIKPLASKHKFTLTTPVEVVAIGDRIYFQATARFAVDGDQIEVTAFAREPLSRKGMDESQISGATHSYAVKYALCALLLLDDNRDADSQPPVDRRDDDAVMTELQPEIDGAKSREELREIYSRVWVLNEDDTVSAEVLQWTKDRCARKASAEGWSNNGAEQSTDG